MTSPYPWILHVDLDQFLAAVEIRRRPELRGRPVIVGGTGDPTQPRMVVATASYEARRFGVRSGMPLRAAARRCPDAVFLPSDRAAYQEASDEVMATLRRFPARVEVWGWDEAFLGGFSGDPQALAAEVQRTVLAETGLTCAVGIGDTKLRAKMATGFGKPGGIYRLTHDNWLTVLGDQRTDALWGVGSKTARRLAEVGIHTVADLARADPAELAEHFGPTTGPWLVQLGRGGGSTQVDAQPRIARSRSRETTFPEDLNGPDSDRRPVAGSGPRAGPRGRRRRAPRAASRGQDSLPVVHDANPNHHPAGGNAGCRGYRKRRARALGALPSRAGRAIARGTGRIRSFLISEPAKTASRRSDWNGLVLTSVPATRFG